MFRWFRIKLTSKTKLEVKIKMKLEPVDVERGTRVKEGGSRLYYLGRL